MAADLAGVHFCNIVLSEACFADDSESLVQHLYCSGCFFFKWLARLVVPPPSASFRSQSLQATFFCAFPSFPSPETTTGSSKNSHTAQHWYVLVSPFSHKFTTYTCNCACALCIINIHELQKMYPDRECSSRYPDIAIIRFSPSNYMLCVVVTIKFCCYILHAGIEVSVDSGVIIYQRLVL